MAALAAPIVETHHGIAVVRDDLLPGGTKTRYLAELFRDVDEVVYASPVQGGAQVALATVARKLGKRTTIFCAGRAERHPRTLQAEQLGAKICEIRPGYLNVIQARATQYCADTGAKLAPFGLAIPASAQFISDAAVNTGVIPDEVWCAAGSGTLSRGLQQAWPSAEHHVVQVGHKLTLPESEMAEVHLSGVPFDKAHRGPVPFASDRHYDAKAWAACLAHSRPANRVVLFWNVLG